MPSALCERLGIDFPLFGFSHCRDVVVAVSKAGGMGVLGVAGFSPSILEEELAWIDLHVDGRPYAVDLIVPAKFAPIGRNPEGADTLAMIPASTREFVRDLLARYDIDADCLSDQALLGQTDFGENMEDDRAMEGLEVAFSHPIRLIANALGPPPEYMMQHARARGTGGRTCGD